MNECESECGQESWSVCKEKHAEQQRDVCMEREIVKRDYSS